MNNREQLNLFGNYKYDAINNAVDEDFWVYHAGMADGDGCIQRTNNKYKKAWYSLRLIDKNVTEELANLYGVKKSYKMKKKKDHHRQMYKVLLHGDNCKHFFSKIAPYMIEKRKELYEICKDQNIKICEPEYPIDTSRRLMWMVGYFDAEGSVKMNHIWRKDTKNYSFDYRVKFTSTDLKTMRFVKKLLNRTFGRASLDPPFKLYKKNNGEKYKQAYDVVLRQAHKIYIFGKVILPFIKIKRKIDKFERVFSYAKFAANMNWRFGKFNFKKNKKMKENYSK